jgi:hypothetical protein
MMVKVLDMDVDITDPIVRAIGHISEPRTDDPVWNELDSLVSILEDLLTEGQ